MSLSSEEIERYARHLVLREIGGPGQQKLKSSRVLVIGAGGLGAPLLQYLAAAGVGTLGIVDNDAVSLSNLQRQVIHDSAGVGRLKVDSAQAAIAHGFLSGAALCGSASFVPLFVQAVLDLSVFLPVNRHADLAEGRMNHFILKHFDVKFHKSRGLVAMKVA